MKNQLAPRKNALQSMASRLAISTERLTDTLKKTAFKSCQTDEQFAALLIVAESYKLNPFTKEIYAFPGQKGEIVPVVSIDGWLRIINDHPQMDGMDEEWGEDGEWCKISIYRKDRSRPIIHTEYLEEVSRNTDPWKKHPRRMLKWKTIIQAARIAFGFGGIHDEDDAHDIGQTVIIEDEPEPTKALPEPVKAKVRNQASQPETTEELI